MIDCLPRGRGGAWGLGRRGWWGSGKWSCKGCLHYLHSLYSLAFLWNLGVHPSGMMDYKLKMDSENLLFDEVQIVFVVTQIA